MFALYPVAFIVASVFLVVASPAPPAAAQSESDSPLTIEVAASIGRVVDRPLTGATNVSCNALFARQKALRGNCPAVRGQGAAFDRSVERRNRRPGRGGDWEPTMARTYRTICVRVCDGYYYTLSLTASRRRFEQDAERCMGQYPPGKAMLFYHPFPRGDAGQAVSLKGERYADQDYAFAFRTKFIPGCAAELQEGLAALKARVYAAVPWLVGEPAAAPAEPEPGSFVPIPVAWQDRAIDPETLANRAGNLVPAPIAAPHKAVAVRTVGDPNYFDRVNRGPPATVPGYVPPELKDYRVPQSSASLRQTIN